jgi:hypothetical protein
MKEISDLFLEFENNNLLFNEAIKDIKYWHLVRFSIYEKILNQKKIVGQAHTNLRNESNVSKIFLKIKQLRYFFFNNPLLTFKQRDLLILSHQRRVKDKSSYTCLYTDLLINKINLTNIVLEDPYLETHMRPVEDKEILYSDYINFIGAIKKRIFKLKYTKEENKSIMKLVDSINHHFDVIFEYSEIEELVKNSLINFKYSIKYYKIIHFAKIQNILLYL